MAARRLLWGCGIGFVGVGGTAACACGVGATVSPGFRRSCQFWGAVAPFVIEHNQIKWWARFEGCDAEELERRLGEFHRRTASRAVEVILRLGGIYVKIGQFASTMGNGVLFPLPTGRTPCMRSSGAGARRCSRPRTPCMRSSLFPQ